MRQTICANCSLISKATLRNWFAVSILGDIKSTLTSYTTVIIEHLAIGNITMLLNQLKRAKALGAGMRFSLIFATEKAVMPALR